MANKSSVRSSKQDSLSEQIVFLGTTRFLSDAGIGPSSGDWSNVKLYHCKVDNLPLPDLGIKVYASVIALGPGRGRENYEMRGGFGIDEIVFGAARWGAIVRHSESNGILPIIPGLYAHQIELYSERDGER